MDKNGQLLEEYKMLRSEILYFMNKDTTLFTCLFSSVTATLFFALKERMPEGCLLAFLIILPVCNKFVYHQKQMAKISTYLSSVLEKELYIKWETDVIKIKEKGTKAENSSRKVYTRNKTKFLECPIMALASLLSYIFLVIRGKMWRLNIFVFGLETLLILILFFIVIIMSSEIYKTKDYRTKYSNLW